MSRIQGLVSKVQCGNSFLITSQYLKHPKSGNHKHNTEKLNLLSYLTSIYTSGNDDMEDGVGAFQFVFISSNPTIEPLRLRSNLSGIC